MRTALRFYRLLLVLLPPGFRRLYGAAMVEEARRSLLDEPRRRWRIVVRLVWDLAVTLVREWGDALAQTMRDVVGGGMSSDVRCALRASLRTPGFAVGVIGILGLGIGTTTVALGMADAYLLGSLPFPEGERLMAVWPEENWSVQMLDLARQRFPSLEALAARGGVELVIREGGEAEEIFACLATTNLHDVLGVPPAVGRGFVVTDALPGAEPVAIVSHRVWVERLGADLDAVGRRIALEGDGHLNRTLVGVMPASYVPLQGTGVDAWVPVVIDRSSDAYGESHFLQAIGRLAPGARAEDADRDTRSFARRMGELRPGTFSPERVGRAGALPLTHERSSARRSPVLLALGAALLVLLAACANVANLVVARTIGRERELSVRAALGAGRVRTARTVLLEVTFLSALGAAVGIAIALGLMHAFERWIPGALPYWGMEVDPRWGLAAALLGVLAALAAGAIPAFQAARRDPARAMGGGRGTSGHRRLARVQETLSVAQLAVATAGVATMGLLGRSLLELTRVDPGFTVERAITFRVTAPPSAYPEDVDVTRFFREARALLSEVPGIEVAGFGSLLPLAYGDSRTSVMPEGHEFPEGAARPVAWHRLVTPGYLEALGARVVEGRIPSAEDDRDDLPEQVVINSAAAHAFWPGESAVGKQFYGRGGRVWLTVAGVVENVMENGQMGSVLPALYIPHRERPRRTMYAVARTVEGPGNFVPEMKKAIRTLSADVPISRVETLGQIAERGLRPTRSLAILASAAGAVTLLLGALGIYGVVGHAVARRRRELGVRAALGAGRSRLLRDELTGTTRMVAAGLCAGLFLSWMTGRALRGVLFGVGVLDLPTFAVTVGLLATVAYLAAYLPARRAATVDPAQVIREE